MNELKVKLFEHEEIDECMLECYKWIAGIVGEYSDNFILDIVVYKQDGNWQIAVYHRL